MNSNWRWKMSVGSLSNPTMNPPMTSRPARCSVLTVSTRSRLQFCSFAAFLQALQRGRLEPDEDLLETGADHEVAELGVVGQVGRRLGQESHLGAGPRSPVDELPQQRLGLLLVADEVVVDDEDHVLPSAQAEFFQLGDQLGGRLGARHAAVHDDDVAELAIERAAPRELDRHGDIVAEVDQIPAGRRHASDVGPARRGVGGADRPAAHVFDDLRHEVFGFAQARNGRCPERPHGRS